MSRSQFQSKRFILRHAWLNLWDERMTTGRINQIAIFHTPGFASTWKGTWRDVLPNKQNPYNSWLVMVNRLLDWEKNSLRWHCRWHMFSTILSLTHCQSLMSFRKLQLDKSILKTTSRFGWSQMLLLHIMQPLHCHNQRETTWCFLRPIWTNPRCRCTTTTSNPTSLTSCSQKSDWQVKLSGSHTNFDCAWFMV